MGEGSVELSMKVRLPHPVHQAALNDRTTEVSLLASPRVLKASDEYVDRLHHVDLAGVPEPVDEDGVVDLPSAIAPPEVLEVLQLEIVAVRALVEPHR